MTWSQDIGKRILACSGYDFEGPIAASMTFYAAGRWLVPADLAGYPVSAPQRRLIKALTRPGRQRRLF